ncbi:CpaF family protein [Luteitalea sp. TBR-22]|uniref:CpaF family protein n=1 Tax=Luteitalea sp. TBR-22 TaxID=2802971 RepID=UPI001EF617FB|nr:ATPase, T2SS/T4P/T4SS family [Luteitalea sp. TBR-22]
MQMIDKPGLAPIRHLLEDPAITEIMINGSQQVYVERAGQMVEVPGVFTHASQLDLLVDNLVVAAGRGVNARSPMADFRMDDGSRVNVCIAPVSLQGPAVTIRKFTHAVRTFNDLVRHGTLTMPMAEFLTCAVRARLNIVFAGGTGTGKTTTLGIMANQITRGERVVVIEDTAELDLAIAHCVRLEARRANNEGAGAITLADLLRNSLRMRPTRILVGEIRGDEAFEMLHAMTSGHDGSMAVLHASSPAHAVARLELMLLSRGLELPLWAIQRQISTSVDLILQHQILQDGVRRITHVSEVGPVQDGQVSIRHLFEYRLAGYAADGRAVGEFVATGTRPKFREKLRLAAGPGVDRLLGLTGP